MTTAALFTILLLCLLTGMPIAFALGLSSITTILLFSHDSLASIALKLLEAESAHYTLLAIPFFILSSTFLSTGGVATRIINFAIDCVGWIRGGLAMASVLACMIFAAVSGSSPATVAAIGSIVIAGMVQAGYPKAMAAGVITNAGTLGILIPPSIVMLVYAAATEESAARLFMAGFLPGIMMGVLLMIAIYIVARIKGLPAQPWVGSKALMKTGFSASWGLMLIIIVLGSIYGGICSPTEAAAISAVYAFFIAIFVYRDMGPIKGAKWQENPDDGPVKIIVHNLLLTAKALPLSLVHKDTKKVLIDAAKVSIMLLFIIGNAMLFAHVLTTERIPHHIAEIIVGWGLPSWGFLIVVNILLLIAGNFM
jgi:C4-dicarboxylate transporter DctM subunit